MHRKTRFLLPALGFVLFAFPGLSVSRADVHMPAIFSDHMVLQQDAVVAFWGSADPAEKFGTWQPCTPDMIAKGGYRNGFSAVAYFFAREIQKSTGHPIGLISCNWGGTTAEA